MESTYFRTFIGLPLRLDQEMLHARSELLSAFEGERISWVDPVRFHVTIRFLGETKVSSVKEIGRALCSGVTLPEPNRLEMTGLSSFGPKKRPRVVWVGFEQTDFFELLKSEVDQILYGCGFPIEEQPFRAHMTLGRVRNLRNLTRFYDIIDEMSGHFRNPVLFEKLVFYRSLIGRGGPEYHVLDEISFRQGINPSGSRSIHHPS
jgi:2'-5' RNA ligase